MISRQLLLVVAATVCVRSSAGAQQAVMPAAAAIAADSANAVVHAARRSIIDRPSDAVRLVAPASPMPVPATSAHLGEAKAEMIVGGAAIVVGSIIGGGGGRVLVFGGAVVGLYGLWNYLK